MAINLYRTTDPKNYLYMGDTPINKPQSPRKWSNEILRGMGVLYIGEFMGRRFDLLKMPQGLCIPEVICISLIGSRCVDTIANALIPNDDEENLDNVPGWKQAVVVAFRIFAGLFILYSVTKARGHQLTLKESKTFIIYISKMTFFNIGIQKTLEFMKGFYNGFQGSVKNGMYPQDRSNTQKNNQ
ncbi:MAG: hypothetical protein AAF443_07585 [Chlamydiota bacterium]